MKIYLATDHAGFELKEAVKKFLIDENYEIEDCGAFSFEKDDDYPNFIVKVAEKVSENHGTRGIVFGKSGTGEEIVANKVDNVRAFAGISEENVRLARQDNDANILSLGSEFVDLEKAKRLIKIFLDTHFSNEERHERRLDEITEIEEKEEM
jgi:ribose 5-phosphate isomerase B